MGSTRCHILIGRYCSIAHRVTFEVGLNHDYHYATTYPFDDFEIGDPVNANHFDDANKNQVVIGNDVWIGCDVIILGGVHIGNGAVIGAGTVVAKDIPPYSVVVGNPARVIKYRFEQDVIQRLQNIKWWYWPVEEIKTKYQLMKNVEEFLLSSDNFSNHEAPDNAVETLKQLKEDGYYIYYMAVDFQFPDQIWDSVLNEFLDNFTVNDSVLLVIELVGRTDDIMLGKMSKMVESRGEDAPIVITHENINFVNVDLLHLVDTYITTKDSYSSVIVDFLSESNTDIIYGLDHGGHIFKNYIAMQKNNIK
ncbi:MAG: CatB-related O-acetyltransferase [Anaerovibrio sp.]|nr:CatB-related O-acetyltransferase [Anaerovibrio sp.]